MSQELSPIPEDLSRVERALGALKPAAAALDRDQLMYEAGRVAERRQARMRLRIWQGACALLVLGCAGWAAFPREKAVEQPHVAQRPAKPTPMPATPSVAIAAPNPPLELPALWLPALRQVRRSIDMTDWPVVLGGEANRTAGEGNRNVPALRRGEGLDSLPKWQQQQVQDGGNPL